MKNSFSILMLALVALAFHLPTYAESPMYHYGIKSQEQLATCDRDIVVVFNEVIKHVDCSILEGARTTARQQRYFREGKSKIDGVTQFSKHQVGKLGNEERMYSLAVDAIPWPLELNGLSVWHDDFRFTLFAGEVLATAWSKGVELRWGGDWDGDGSRRDQTFHDLPHFEKVIRV